MCFLCDVTKTFDPARHMTGEENVRGTSADPGAPSLASYTESSDAAEWTTTAYAMSVGDTFSGMLDSTGDRDWVGVTLQDGQAYSIQLLGAGSGLGTLTDTYLRIYDQWGNLVAQNDDGGAGTDSELVFTPGATGTYFISAGSWNDSHTGSYVMSVQTSSQTPPPVGTLDELADYLTDGYWNDAGVSGHSWDTSSSNQITVDITSLSSDAQRLARWAFEAWELVANIDFVEVSGSADITFSDAGSGNSASTGYSAYSNGNMASSDVTITEGWLNTYGTDIDGYSFSTYIHEIGHALGLGHLGDYNGAATYGSDETFANDSWQVSIMSYFNQVENTTVTASLAEVITAQIADIVAVQNLYGAPTASSATAGNTVWGQGTTVTSYLEYLFDALAGGSGGGYYSGGPVTMTIYDVDGTDLLDFGFSTTDDTFNMTPLGISDVLGLTGNLIIASGTYIENLTTGSGNDTVNGNGLTNVIVTGDGDDWIDASYGYDGVWTGNGDDFVLGGGGNDKIGGMNGADTLWGGTGNDTVWGGGWGDIVGGGDGDDLLYGDKGSDELWGSDGDDTLYAGIHDDTLYGGNDEDVLYGEDGADLLYGGADNDTLNGGDGNDVLNGDAGDDVLNGGNQNDGLWGGLGNDTMNGGAGDDRLGGGWGDDLQTGGLGADEFRFGTNLGNDTVTDLSLGEGDTLWIDDANWTGTHGALTPAQVIAQFHSFDTSGFVVLNMPDGSSITLSGITSTTGLDQALVIF